MCRKFYTICMVDDATRKSSWILDCLIYHSLLLIKSPWHSVGRISQRGAPIMHIFGFDGCSFACDSSDGICFSSHSLPIYYYRKTFFSGVAIKTISYGNFIAVPSINRPTTRNFIWATCRKATALRPTSATTPRTLWWSIPSSAWFLLSAAFIFFRRLPRRKRRRCKLWQYK